MSITRDEIIAAMQAYFESDTDVLAMWLEGADATGHVDGYSDIDLNCSVKAGAMDAVTTRAQAALESLGKMDLIEKSASEPDTQFTVFHLKDTSPYLLIDFNVYVGRGSQFFEGDMVEKPLILFDRGNVIQFVKPDPRGIMMQRTERLSVLQNTTAQYSRIEKYIRRGDFLEAFGYYHKWLLTPLVEVLRMRYTPLHPDYYIVHISRHLPADVLCRLEECFMVGSLADLETKSRRAYAFFQETATFLRENAAR